MATRRSQSRSLLAPYSSTRLWLKVALTVAGVLAGAAFGVALTKLGKIIAGAPPATLENYMWNAAVFGVMAGIVSPLVSWWALRRAPLWRTVVEPLGYAVAGGGMAVLIGVPALILVLPPLGLALALPDCASATRSPGRCYRFGPVPMTEAGRPPAIHADGFTSHA